MSPLDILFPRWCVLCGYVGTYLCDSCASSLIKAKRVCHYCQKRARLGLTHPGCRRKQGIDGELCVFVYESKLASVLYRAKYQGAWKLLDVMCEKISKTTQTDLGIWKKLFKPEVVPVPLHEHKKRQRGFNQSEIIAEKLCGYVKNKSPYLVRRRENVPQAVLTKKNERRKNVRGIFEAVQVAPQTVLLIDDVITTGSTIEECTRVLKHAGTKTVLALSIAKG